MHILSTMDGKTIAMVVVIIGAVLLLIKGMNTAPRDGNNGNGNCRTNNTATNTNNTMSTTNMQQNTMQNNQQVNQNNQQNGQRF